MGGSPRKKKKKLVTLSETEPLTNECQCMENNSLEFADVTRDDGRSPDEEVRVFGFKSKAAVFQNFTLELVVATHKPFES